MPLAQPVPHGWTQVPVGTSHVRPFTQSPSVVHCGRHAPTSQYWLFGQSPLPRHCWHLSPTQNAPAHWLSLVQSATHVPSTHARFAPQSGSVTHWTQMPTAVLHV